MFRPVGLLTRIVLVLIMVFVVRTFLVPPQPTETDDFRTSNQPGGEYKLVTSTKYHFSFEAPSDLKFYSSDSGTSQSFSFMSSRRQRNDSSARFIYTVRAEVAKDTCSRYPKANPSWKKTTHRGYPATKITSSTGTTIIICRSGSDYHFTYSSAYEPKKLGPLTAEELQAEENGYQHILDSFKIINE